MAVSFFLNGAPVDIPDDPHVDPHVTLLQWLRGAGLCGTKEGCAEGECGACAVAVLRGGFSEPGRARYEAVNSCLLPLAALHGLSVVTVEGVAPTEGELHPVQRALVEHGASQCGYCTPGFVVSLFCEYYRPERTGFDPESISGNLCRCTGYRPIVDAARSLGVPPAADRRLPLLQAKPARLAASTLADSERRFLRPASLSGVFDALRLYPDATLIAGGTDLIALANQRDTRWQTLVSLAGVEELGVFEVRSDGVMLGAGLSLSELERRETLPILAELWPLFSSRLIRNQATLGGNLATASPIGDAAPALLALDAEVVLVNALGERRLPLADFFLGYRKTALVPGELIQAVFVPVPAPAIQRFYKASKRVLDDISTVAAAFALDRDEHGTITRFRAAYGGIAATPLRARELEALALGKPWNRETLDLLLEGASKLGTPLDDHRGSAAYRRAMIGKLLEKFFYEVAA
jgi:xanthine dehydrogenase small subunit